MGADGGFESRVPLRSGNRHGGVLPLPLSRQDRLHVWLPDRLRPELDLQPVDGVIGADLTEDHLQDALLSSSAITDQTSAMDSRR